MATGFEFFARDLTVATAGLEPEAINKAVAAFAKQEVRRVVSEGIASPQYDRFVNAVQGAPEEAYKAPGSIVYEFVNWPLAVNFVLAELAKRMPRSVSGRFAASFIVIVGGRVINDFSSIDGSQEVIVTNFQPYVRKAEVGRLGIPKRRLFDGTKRAFNARFNGAFVAETRFLNISGGVHPMIPYVLKGGGKLKAAAQNSRSSAFRAGRATLARAKDREAGMPITYPSVVINMVS